MDYRLLMVDPCAAHKKMTMEGKREALLSFVRNMAMSHRITLAVDPRWDTDIDRWKMVAKILSDDVVLNPPSDKVDKKIDYVSRGKYKAHFRSACLVHRGKEEFIRLGCLVNKRLLEKKEEQGFQSLVDAYNMRVMKLYEGKYEFMSMRAWMESRDLQPTMEV